MRLIVMLLLALVSSGVMAEWTKLGSAGSGIDYFDHYGDISTITRTGATVRMWTLSDFKTVQRFSDGGGQVRAYLSVVALDEFNCGAKQRRTLSINFYSNAMGRGAVVRSSDSPRNWRYVVPGTVGETLMGVACGETPTAPRTSLPPNASFSLVNRSQQNILNIYVSPVESDKWGQDRLPGILRSGGKEWIDMPRDGRCEYDVRVMYSDRSEETKTRQNLCDVIELVFDGSRRTAATGGTAGRQAPASPTARGTSYGTGFFVSPLGHALTNHHVVESCRSISAHLPSGKLSAEVLRHDSQNDLALVRVQTSGAVNFVNFRSSPAVKLGENVVVAGFPLSNILQNGLNATVGNVSALAGLRGNASHLQITAPVQQGNSGGPLLDMSGNLVGVVVSKLNAERVAQATGDIPQNVNFAVKGTVARLFLEASGQRVNDSPSDTELRVGQVTDQARDFTFQIECQN